ncbi:GNAT family N-acetyltransferase [Alteromonas sp. S015]|uniref:GNAT family N-acetyltransferase n=1 Tax=Alteromonas sp. S015 TaxID=3117401 RepID=UPI002FE2D30B
MNVTIPEGLKMRPSQPSDAPFLEQLHRSQRDDLQLIDGEQDFIESIVDMQFRAQNEGYGQQTPNAMYFVVEKHQDKVGKVTVDFGHNSVHVVDIAFIPQVRGLGFGKDVLRSLQVAAAQSRVPLTLNVSEQNIHARRLYTSLGFQIEHHTPPTIGMIWYPQ